MSLLTRLLRRGAAPEPPPPDALLSDAPLPPPESGPEPEALAPWRLPHDGIATTQDIHHLFRLLLGRHCSAAEWPGHSARAGEPIDTLLRDFLACREFAERGVMATPEADIVSGEVPGATPGATGGFTLFARADDRTIGGPALAGRYEPLVAAAFRALLAEGDGVLDIGANIGYFTLLAATLVGPRGHVFAIEPNPANVALLERSLAANGFGHVSVLQVGASRRIETLALHATTGNGATSVLDPAAGAARTAAGLPVDVAVSARRHRIALVKIDVEGFEYEAMQGAEGVLKQDRPAILFEFTPTGLIGIDGPGFLDWLSARGYAFELLERDASPRSQAEIMDAYARAGVEHIDVLARPA